MTDIKPFRDAVFARAAETLAWLTVPIVHRRAGQAIALRTGVLLQIGSMKFLITAGHNMMEHNSEGRSPELVMPDKGKPTVPLSEEWFWSTKSEAEDLAVCQLTPKTVEELGDRFRYASLSDFMNQHDPQHGLGLYLLYGFPNDMGASESDGTKRLEPWSYLSSLYEGDRSAVANYDPHRQVLLEYEKLTTNAQGKRVWPHGMSGCGIWFCGHPITHSPVSQADFKLVGIQTAWHKEHEYAKGTWIDVALVIIWNYYSDARNIMRLHGMEF